MLDENPFSESDIHNLSLLAGQSLKQLKEKDYPDLLIFPQNLFECKDEIENQIIYSLDKESKTLQTQNMMGFIGINDTQLSICSRFTKNEKNDYFLHYMLQKVFSIHIVKFEHSFSDDKIFEFLLYMFPHFLKKALQQGIFKEYQGRSYNDANVKGSIDVNRQVRSNIPFAGKIAYRTREFSRDNHVTQLIRHTIEYIQSHPFGQNILHIDEDTKMYVQQIIDTTPSYDRNRRWGIMNENERSVKHPFYSEYTNLQKICLQILRHEKIKYSKEKDKMYGILFDGAWLWEEYLGIILEKELIHYYHKKGRNWYLFEKNKQQIIPDYLSNEKGDENKREFVADAKYIPLNRWESTNNEERALAIYYKTVMYMYRFQSELGFLLYPMQNEGHESKRMMIAGRNSHVVKLGFAIPKEDDSNDFTAYCVAMNKKEEEYINFIRAIKAELLEHSSCSHDTKDSYL